MPSGGAGRLTWRAAGDDWPNREASRFVDAAGMRWHVQCLGAGPVLLLLHGTGAATHSWRDIAPLLATEFTVIAPDLPGHGFTDSPAAERLSMSGMAEDLAELLRVLDVVPAIAVGHSAGAAILLRMILDGRISPAAVVSLNGALLPMRGFAGVVFAPTAKLLAGCAAVPRLFARRAAESAAVERLIRNTGSTLDPAGTRLYQRVIATPAHCAAALGMMARWDLRQLEQDLDGLRTPLVLVVGLEDRAIPPADAGRVRRRVADARIVPLAGLGHLAHEEKPATVAGIVADAAWRLRVLPPSIAAHA